MLQVQNEPYLTHFLRFSSPYQMLLKGYLLILSFCLKTFQNLYCQGSVFYYNYFPYFYQRSFFFLCRSGGDYWSQSWLFFACVKLFPKLFQSWSIGLDPFLSECLVSPDDLLILEWREYLEHTTVDLVTLKPSLPSCHFIKLLQSFISNFSLGKWKKLFPVGFLSLFWI